MGASSSKRRRSEADPVAAAASVAQRTGAAFDILSGAVSAVPVSAVRVSVSSVSIDAVPARQAVLCGVEQKLNVLVRIKTPAAPDDARRPSLHVACVLDKSGSMNGQKLKDAKRAVRKLVRHLDAASCKLSFVTYDTDVQRVFDDGDLSDDGKAGLVEQIKAVRCGSATNLCGGLLEGAACLRDLVRSAKEPPSARRIFLFSDGLVNAGVKDRAEILGSVDGLVSEGITVSTFGIGTDFDEALMGGIARHGKGKYAFLETSESIPRLVSQSVHSLLSLAGSEARLEIRGLNGAVVTRVHAADDDEDDEGGGGGDAASAGLVSLGDLHWRNVRSCLVELRISAPGVASGAPPPPPVPVLECTLSYEAEKQAEQQARLAISGVCSVGFVSERAALPAEDGDVTSAAAIQASVATDAQVLQLVQRGEADGAAALKERSIESLSALLKQLAKEPRYRDGCCVRLAQVLERSRRTLENMRAGKQARAVEMEMRYEMRVRRAMSDDGMCERADSEGGVYSDEEDEGPNGWGSPRRSGSPPVFRRAGSGSESGSDDGHLDSLEARLIGLRRGGSPRPFRPPSPPAPPPAERAGGDAASAGKVEEPTWLVPD